MIEIDKNQWNAQGDVIGILGSAFDCGHSQAIDKNMVKDGVVKDFRCAECHGRANTLDDQINRAIDAHAIAVIDRQTLDGIKTLKATAESDLTKAKDETKLSIQSEIDAHNEKIRVVEARGVTDSDIARLAADVTALQAKRAKISYLKGDLLLLGA